MGLLDSLMQAVGAANSQPFDQVAREAPADVLAKGLAAAFGSDQTPAIGNMVSQIFERSNGEQKAGMLNQLIAALGPTVMAGLAGGTLGRMMDPGQARITPEQAQQLSPQEVQEVVNHAHQVHPGVADHLGEFYAQHRGLLNTLGALAATVAMARMKDHTEST